jgi:prepilin-type N-terminal cleavage/methylation domain-containing protein
MIRWTPMFYRRFARHRFGRSLTLPGNESSCRRSSVNRRGFTLLELILSLALCAVVAGLIGSLVHIYLINQETGRDSVQQSQMARAILNMIAEDVRTSVRYQSFDTSGLQELLSGATGGGSSGGGSSGGGATSGGSSGGSSSGGGGTTGAATSGGTSGASAGGASSSGSGATDTSSNSTTTTAPLPPGIYGSSTSIEIDVSRLPRPDEYYPKVGNTSLGTLGDMPSDVKTVGYYVQSPRSDGVQDSLGQLSQQAASLNSGTLAMANGGLIRRSVDRAVTQYSYEMGQSSQLQRTGELIAPEVLAIEFQYFDGATWQTQWDGSQQGLPHVVKITIAMQRESKAKSNPLSPGLAISTISTSMIQEYGIEIYSTNTIIPGAQLLVAPQGTTATGSTDTGMSKMGL